MGEVETMILVVVDSKYEIPFFNWAVPNPRNKNPVETVRGRQF